MAEPRQRQPEPAAVATGPVLWVSLALTLLPAVCIAIVAGTFYVAGIPTAPTLARPPAPLPDPSKERDRDRAPPLATSRMTDVQRRAIDRAMEAVARRTDPYAPVRKTSPGGEGGR